MRLQHLHLAALHYELAVERVEAPAPGQDNPYFGIQNTGLTRVVNQVSCHLKAANRLSVIGMQWTKFIFIVR